MSDFRAVSVVKYGFTLIGVIVLLITHHIYSGVRDFVDISASADGVVIRQIKHENYDGTEYQPVVRFVTPEGEKVEFRAQMSSSPPLYDVGEAVEVLYDPADPAKAKIGGFFAIWAATLIVGTLGVIATLSGLGLLVGTYLADRDKT